MTSLLALFEGRLAEAEGLIAQAYDHGRRAESVHAVGVRRFQEYALRREQDRAVEMDQPLGELVDSYRFWPWVPAVVAHLQAELGRTAEARRQFDACAAADFQDLPLDNDWLLGLTLLADVCTFLGDEHHAATLYALLSPYERRNAFGHPEFSTGAVARPLANLAATMGRFDDAERHFATAVEMNVRMGALPWVAHTRHELALMLIKRGNPTDRKQAVEQLRQATGTAAALGQVALQKRIATALASLDNGQRDVTTMPAPRTSPGQATTPNVFRREGELWYLAFDGHETRLHHAKGLSYLSTLLASPGREIHALDLASSRGRAPRMTGRATDDLGGTGRADIGPILDDQAKRAYRERINELQAAVDEAEAWNDPDRAAQARHELDFLVQELTAATGLGGRDRRMGSDAERARVNVTRAIHSALARIQEHHPQLGRHLKRTVHTGTFCVYTPDPRTPTHWTV